jgi:hypothetical protein
MCFPWNKVPRFTSIQNAAEIVVLWTCKVELQSCLKWARWLVAERDSCHYFIVILISVCRSYIHLEMFSPYLRWSHYFFLSIFISHLVLSIISFAPNSLLACLTRSGDPLNQSLAGNMLQLCCPRHSGMLPADVFDMRKLLSLGSPPLAKPR